MADDFILSDEQIKTMKDEPRGLSGYIAKKKAAHLQRLQEKTAVAKIKREQLAGENKIRSAYAAEKAALKRERQAAFNSHIAPVRTFAANFKQGVEKLDKRAVSRPHKGLVSQRVENRPFNGNLFGDTSGASWLNEKPQGADHLFGRKSMTTVGKKKKYDLFER